eukprot:363177-Chlamydomonas_euryale.AAC.3
MHPPGYTHLLDLHPCPIRRYGLAPSRSFPPNLSTSPTQSARTPCVCVCSSSSRTFTHSFRRHSWQVHAEKVKPEAKLCPYARWTKKHDHAITAPRQLVPATAPDPVPASPGLFNGALYNDCDLVEEVMKVIASGKAIVNASASRVDQTGSNRSHPQAVDKGKGQAGAAGKKDGKGVDQDQQGGRQESRGRDA